MSIVLVLGGLGALAGGATNGFKDWNPSSWANNLGTNIKNTWDYIKNGNTNSMNYDIAMKNLEMQQNENEYQHALQERIFNREDTAYQRTVEDMRQAGLNPLAMNGTDSAGEAIATEAPQMNYQQEDKSPIEIMSELFAIANAGQDFEIGMAYNEESQAKAEQAKAEAEIKKNLAIESKADTEYNLQKKKLETEDLIRNSEYNNRHKIYNGMSDRDRYVYYTDRLNNEELDDRLRTNYEKWVHDYESSDTFSRKWTGANGAEKVNNVINKVMEKGAEKVAEMQRNIKKYNNRGSDIQTRKGKSMKQIQVERNKKR